MSGPPGPARGRAVTRTGGVAAAAPATAGGTDAAERAAEPDPPWAAALATITTLPGVSPAAAARLAKRLGRAEPRVLDVLWILPREWPAAGDITDLAPHRGNTVTLSVEVLAHREGRGRAPFVATTTTGGDALDLTFFTGSASWPARRFPVGARLTVRGKVTGRGDGFAMAHPILVPPLAEGADAAPLYPRLEGIAPGRLAAWLEAALARLPPGPEWIAPSLLAQREWPSFAQALAAQHGEPDQAVRERARTRLAFDELLAGQLRLERARARREGQRCPPLPSTGPLLDAWRAALPYVPTADQATAMAEIAGDLGRGRPMRRLLQGDVGSGKTLVAAFALLAAAAAGRQALLLAPTELLARQHHATLRGFAEPLGLEVGLLAGGVAPAERRRWRERFASRACPLLVGTQALLEPTLNPADLALAVVDEQHRLGVDQRRALLAKGDAVHLLLMSATPIPRTLLMALDGGLDVSSLLHRPPGRLPVATRLVAASRQEEVVAACARALADDALIYWICPLLEGDEGQGSVLARHATLRNSFGTTVGLAHGGQPPLERQAAMDAFAAGRTRLLVATTVVEVGIDVPAASILVVEAAERFGLAQLHQLRGRIGRGTRASTCLMLVGDDATPAAQARLELLRHSDDGFAIAEADLALRGPGEVLSRRQSGLPRFTIADLATDAPLLPLAARQAKLLLAGGPSSATEPVLRLLAAVFPRPSS